MAWARLVAVLWLLLAVPADAPARSAANGAVFSDRVGEVSSCCTRDITSVSVSNDDAGTIVFTVFANGNAHEDDDDLAILIDTDRDLTTGYEGADFQVSAYVVTAQTGKPTLSRWNARRGEFQELVHANVDASSDGDVFRYAVDRHDLGDTDGFRFTAQLWEVTSFGGLHTEFAPDTGMWAFPLRISTRRLRPVVSVSRQAGFLVTRLRLQVADGTRSLASGRISCYAALDGKRLSIAARDFVARRARCAWRVPPRSAGKTVSGSIGVFVTRDRASFVGRRFRFAVSR